MNKVSHVETKAPARRAAAPVANGKSQPAKPELTATKVDKFTYALSAFTVEIRPQGWFVARTVPSFIGERPKWHGPFETIESACLAIARGLAVEIADRHTRTVEAHKIPRTHALYGFKPETRLKSRNGTIV